MVRTINVSFDEKEFKKLLKAKGNKSWHDLILEAIQDD